MLWLLAPVVNLDASPDRSHHLARQTPQLIIEHPRDPRQQGYARPEKQTVEDQRCSAATVAKPLDNACADNAGMSAPKALELAEERSQLG